MQKYKVMVNLINKIGEEADYFLYINLNLYQ